MYVVLGANGHTGSRVANTLLTRGQKVRVVGRSAEHLKTLASEGAEIFVADATDAPNLAKAFQGAAAAFVLIPPDMTSHDYRGFQDRVSDAIAAGIENAKVKYVVSLSSFGADKSSGTGPVVGLYNMEQRLNQIEHLHVLHLRAGYFMENTLPQVMAIQHMGSTIGPVRPTLTLPMIATRDVGAAAGDALLKLEFRGKNTRELQGQRDLDYVEASSIIGKAIGKNSLGYRQGPAEQMRDAMMQAGMSANFAGLILEMTGALDSGHMKMLEPRSAANSTPTSFETFVKESFVPAFLEKVAA